MNEYLSPALEVASKFDFASREHAAELDFKVGVFV